MSERLQNLSAYAADGLEIDEEDALQARTERSVPVGGAVCAIGAGARFQGLLSFWGSARIEGSLHGEIVARGALELGPQAHVKARVDVDVLIVEGTLEGHVVARERLEVLPGARVLAAIRTPSLVVADGAVFEGRLEMAGSAPAGGGPGDPAVSAA